MNDPRILSEDHLRTLYMRAAHKHLSTSDETDLIDHVDAITEELDRLRGLVDGAVYMVEGYLYFASNHCDPWGEEDAREIRDWLKGAQG